MQENVYQTRIKWLISVHRVILIMIMKMPCPVINRPSVAKACNIAQIERHDIFTEYCCRPSSIEPKRPSGIPVATFTDRSSNIALVSELKEYDPCRNTDAGPTSMAMIIKIKTPIRLYMTKVVLNKRFSCSSSLSASSRATICRTVAPIPRSNKVKNDRIDSENAHIP